MKSSLGSLNNFLLITSIGTNRFKTLRPMLTQIGILQYCGNKLGLNDQKYKQTMNSPIDMISATYSMNSIAESFTIDDIMLGAAYILPNNSFSIAQLSPRPKMLIGTTIGLKGAQNAASQIVLNTNAYLYGISAGGPSYIIFAYN